MFVFLTLLFFILDYISFVKDILIDSLAGISFRNFPFILIQLLISPLAFIAGAKMLNIDSNLKSSALWAVLFTLLFIIAITSIPLSIIAAALSILYVFHDKGKDTNNKLLVLLMAYASGSGHLILLLISLSVIFVYSKLIKNNAK